MIRLGAPIFPAPTQQDDPFDLAQRHRVKGWAAAYVPPTDVNDTPRLREVRAAFEEADVMLAELGYWDNLLDPDPAKAAANQKRMVECLTIADEVGAACAVNVAGSYAAGVSMTDHHPDNFSEEFFDTVAEMARKFIDEVKPTRTSFCYEIFPFNVTYRCANVRRLADAVDRPQFSIHYDLANLIDNAASYFDHGHLLDESRELLGTRIVSAHAKDLTLASPSISVQLDEVLPGRGNLDYAGMLKMLDGLPHYFGGAADLPLMIEHLDTEAEYEEAGVYIRGVAKQHGISLC